MIVFKMQGKEQECLAGDKASLEAPASTHRQDESQNTVGPKRKEWGKKRFHKGQIFRNHFAGS